MPTAEELSDFREQYRAQINKMSRDRYLYDEEYREKIKAKTKARYTRKTKTCEVCNKRMKLDAETCQFCIEKRCKAIKSEYKYEIKQFAESL